MAGRCPRVPTGVPPVIVPPLHFSTLTPVPGLPARVGRTVRALGVTIVDVATAAALAGRGGGLRGGSYAVTARGLRLDRVVVVPGVRVTGNIRSSGAADLRIAGDVAAPGQVIVTRTGRVTGRLGGRDSAFRCGAPGLPAPRASRSPRGRRPVPGSWPPRGGRRRTGSSRARSHFAAFIGRRQPNGRALRSFVARFARVL